MVLVRTEKPSSMKGKMIGQKTRDRARLDGSERRDGSAVKRFGSVQEVSLLLEVSLPFKFFFWEKSLAASGAPVKKTE